MTREFLALAQAEFPPIRETFEKCALCSAVGQSSTRDGVARGPERPLAPTDACPGAAWPGRGRSAPRVTPRRRPAIGPRGAGCRPAP